MTLTVQQQLISARLRHLFTYWAEAGGQEPSEEIVEETFAVLRELSDGGLEEAAAAVERFNSEITSSDPDQSGIALALSQMFLEGSLDCCGIRDGQLAWAPTELGAERYG